jgi:uncharacterized protein YecE (DUF72 family)
MLSTTFPQVITHEKVLAGCEAEFDEFLERMSLLGEKLGPMLLQFPKFDKWAFKSSEEFLDRLRAFLKRMTHPRMKQTREDGAPDQEKETKGLTQRAQRSESTENAEKRKAHALENQTGKDGAPDRESDREKSKSPHATPAYGAPRLAIEIRNKVWLDARFMDALREHNVALALTDTSFLPRPWEMKEKLDLVTADFAYVRWLGDRKRIEEQTKTWDKTIVERQNDLTNWVEVFKAVMTNKKVLKIFAFANNHYAGHAPDTVKQFWELWNSGKR